MTMRKIKNLFIAIFVICFMTSCSNEGGHFISDANQRAEVEKDLQEKMAQLPNGDLFSILKSRNSAEMSPAWVQRAARLFR